MYICETGNIDTILNDLEQLHIEDNDLLVLFVGEENPPDIPRLIKAINERGIKMIGGIFPGIIAGNQVKMSGLAVTKFPLFAEPYRLPDHLQPSVDQFAQKLNELTFPADEKPLALVLSSNLSLTPYEASIFYEALGRILKERVKYIGGASGETVLRPGSYIFDNDGMFPDGTLVALVNTHMSVNHGYGWTTVGKPFIVTKSDKNVILELNGRPALKVYQEQYRLLTGEPIAAEDVNVTQKVHMGFLANRREKIMRGVIGVTPEGGLILAGAVPPKATLFLMMSTQDAMIMNSAKLARDLARATKSPSRAIVVECITRRILLQDKMNEELACVQKELAVDDIVGFLAWGEIGQLQQGSVEFLNESIVIGVEHN